jgi:hypothetical protein
VMHESFTLENRGRGECRAPDDPQPRAMLSKALMMMSLNDLAAPLSLFNHIWCRFFDHPTRRNEPGS